tara:strand:- start:9889 stop:10314 length:426 start_codon:yes stop_codon:yes gene_type:complete
MATVSTLIKTMKDTHNTINERTRAAAQLWEIQNRMAKELKRFKNELINESKTEQQDLSIPSNGYLTTVQKQPPTPKIDTLNPEVLRDWLGEERYAQYIAHSYTIKWSEFRNANQEDQERFYSIPGLELMQTYQVKFSRSMV